MNTPGFTAANSIYRTQRHYRAEGTAPFEQRGRHTAMLASEDLPTEVCNQLHECCKNGGWGCCKDYDKYCAPQIVNDVSWDWLNSSF
jgi:hypothetical protein